MSASGGLLPPDVPEAAPSVAARFDLYQRAGGIITPLLTALLAFFIGGLVVLVTTGKNPLDTYKAIFDGTGLNWLFPWVRGEERELAALNLQQTLILTTTLILVGLAVAFASGCRTWGTCPTWCSRPGQALLLERSGRGSPASSRRPSAPTR
jgi:general nucleoside transport system permease protein